jgi:hypothetical protein
VKNEIIFKKATLYERQVKKQQKLLIRWQSIQIHPTGDEAIIV